MWEIHTDPVKGRKIVATKMISAGTVVLKERPAVIAEDVYDAIYNMYNDNDSDIIVKYTEMVPHALDKHCVKKSDIQDDIETLPMYMRDFFTLMKPERLCLLVTKFHRNAFRYNHKNNPPCAILLKGNMFNHSCDNNLDFFVDSSGTYVFKTNRDIMIGEELCDTYIATNMSTQKRKKILYDQYYFTCVCEKCSYKS